MIQIMVAFKLFDVILIFDFMVVMIKRIGKIIYSFRPYLSSKSFKNLI